MKYKPKDAKELNALVAQLKDELKKGEICFSLAMSDLTPYVSTRRALKLLTSKETRFGESLYIAD